MKKILILLSLFIFVGCVESKNQVEENTKVIFVKENVYKYYPFKSAILIYKQEDDEALYKKVKTWDDWGRKISHIEEFRNKKSVKTRPRSNITQIIRDDSVLYEFEHHKKLVRQRRESIRFLQILSGEDLRKYYLDNSNAIMYTKKTDRTAVVGGVECNIWEGRWVRACRYQDIITLKEEKKMQTGNEWIVLKEVTSAQFNIPIAKQIFQLPKDYKVEVSSTFKTEEELEAYATSYNAKRDINMSVNIVKENYKKLMDARKAYFDIFKRKEEKGTISFII